MLSNELPLEEKIRLFQELESKLPMYFKNEVVYLNTDKDLIRENLLVDKKIFDDIYSKDEELVFYLLPWTRNSRIVERKNVIRIMFPLDKGKEYTATRSYELDCKKMGNFWYHKMYTEESDYEGFCRLQEFGGCSFDYKLPGSRGTVDDGQLKIVVDAVLAVDGLHKKDNLYVLVVGSSSPQGNLSGLAYEIIGQMITNSVIVLYDPFTVNCDYYDSRNNHYIHKAEFFDFKKEYKADLVLDDVWQEGKRHIDIDPKSSVFEIDNFSVKYFPWDEEEGRVYHQLFKTTNFENRLVSRSIKYSFREISDLGKCVSCLELKYLLKGKYDCEMYKMIMNAHKINCKNGQPRTIGDEGIYNVEFSEISRPSDEFVSNLCRLPWDVSLDLKIFPMNRSIMSHICVMVSDEKFLTNTIMQNARGIIRVLGDRWYFFGDMDYFGFIKKREDFDVQQGFTLNLHASYHDMLLRDTKVEIRYDSLRLLFPAKFDDKKDFIISKLVQSLPGAKGFCFKNGKGVVAYIKVGIGYDFYEFNKVRNKYGARSIKIENEMEEVLDKNFFYDKIKDVKPVKQKYIKNKK